MRKVDPEIKTRELREILAKLKSRFDWPVFCPPPHRRRRRRKNWHVRWGESHQPGSHSARLVTWLLIEHSFIWENLKFEGFSYSRIQRHHHHQRGSRSKRKRCEKTVFNGMKEFRFIYFSFFYINSSDSQKNKPDIDELKNISYHCFFSLSSAFPRLNNILD